MENQGCGKMIIMGMVWLGSPVLFMGIMPMISGADGALVSMINFLVGDLSIIASATIVSGVVFIKGLFGLIMSLFKKSKRTVEVHQEEKVPLSFGSASIPITMITFGLAGVLASLFSGQISGSVIISYMLTGIPWGFVTYLLFQKGILDFEDFI